MSSVKEKAEWKPVRFEESDLKFKAEIAGHMVDVMMSPYDVPESIRAYRAANPDWYVIELKYILNDEEKTALRVSEDLSYVIGNASSRLYALQFKFTSTLFESLSAERPRLKWVEIDSAIKRIVDEQKGKKKTESYRLAKKAIFDSRFDLSPKIALTSSAGMT